MLLASFILLIVGFFFPPAWLALLGIGIYFLASRRSRRSDAIESRVRKLVKAGEDYAQFSDLYYEAARGYAVEKGAKAADDQSASATVVVDGRPYWVVFSRAFDGGTCIGVQQR
jgi:hypothetical protein